jgi:hypothetical protein
MITLGILVHSLLNETGSDPLIQTGMALYQKLFRRPQTPNLQPIAGSLCAEIAN